MNPERPEPIGRIGLRVFSNPAWMGGINYVLNWARALRTLPQRPEVLFLHADECGRDLAEAHRNLVDGIERFGEAGRLALDFVYPATQVAEAPFGAPWAGWVPDWQCKHLPEMFDAPERARRDLVYRTLATSAPLLVLSSQMALDDTRRIVGDATVPRRKLPFPAVLDDADYATSPEEIAEARRRHGLPERYLLVCNQFWRHKNHRLVFEALAREQASPVICAFTGETGDPRWPHHFAELRALIADLGIGERVRILGRIDRHDQMRLLLGSVGAIQPSRFEGWSTVVEECRALGKPVILSDFPVHREQAPPGSIFVGTDEPDALAAAMRVLWCDAPPSVPLSEQRDHHRIYVQACARELLSVARQARDAHDPLRHDPSVVMARMLGLLHARRRELDATEAVLRERATAVARSVLKDRSGALDDFMGTVRAEFPEYAAEARAQVEAPVAATTKALARRSGEASNIAPRSWQARRLVARMASLAKQVVRSGLAIVRRGRNPSS